MRKSEARAAMEPDALRRFLATKVLMTPAEVAPALGWSVATAYRHAKDIPGALTIGSRTFVATDHLRAALFADAEVGT